MSHDAQHRKLEARLNQLAKGLNLKWVRCPGESSAENEFLGQCTDGLVVGYGSPQECEVCLGAAQVLILDESAASA